MKITQTIFPSLTHDEWEESKHPRRKDGKFGKDNGKNKSKKDKIKNVNQIEPSPSGANTCLVKGFSNKQKLNNHWQNGRTHQAEYPNYTKEQYVKRAVELIEQPVGGNILGHADKDGVIIRYDKKANDFVKGSIVKGIRTMFKPIDGIKYYEQQRKKDLEHGGRS